MSKKIGIISDTHGVLRPEVLEILKDCDCIFHAGDFHRPEILDTLRPMASIYAVQGNNDRGWAGSLAKKIHFSIDGVNFCMAHNKKDIVRDVGNADVVIFGHSHHYYQEMIDGRLWLNPGSCGSSRFGGEVTMAIMRLENKCCHVEKVVL